MFHVVGPVEFLVTPIQAPNQYHLAGMQFHFVEHTVKFKMNDTSAMSHGHKNTDDFKL